MFSSAMMAGISTSCGTAKCLRSASNNSSLTCTGVRLIAVA
jgi:hypothetical protein